MPACSGYCYSCRTFSYISNQLGKKGSVVDRLKARALVTVQCLLVQKAAHTYLDYFRLLPSPFINVTPFWKTKSRQLIPCRYVFYLRFHRSSLSFQWTMTRGSGKAGVWFVSVTKTFVLVLLLFRVKGLFSAAVYKVSCSKARSNYCADPGWVLVCTNETTEPFHSYGTMTG